MNIRVEIPQLDTVDGVFKLQSGHMSKIQTFVSAHCAAKSAFSGLVLKPLQSHYNGGYDAGYKGMGQGGQIADACSTVIQGNKRQYLKDDKAAYDRLAAQKRKLGENPEPYKPPGPGPAPKPGERAGAPGSSAYDGIKAFLKYGKTVGDKAEAGIKWVNGRPMKDPATKPGLERGKILDPKAWREYYAQRAHERLQANRDWREADRRNGADTRGNSSWTGDQIREERERAQWKKYDERYQRGHDEAAKRVKDGTPYNGPVDDYYRPKNDKRPGSLADGADDVVKDAGRAKRLLGLPSEAIGTAEKVWGAANNMKDSSEALKSVNEATKGPSNTGGIDWAKNTKKGGGW